MSAHLNKSSTEAAQAFVNVDFDFIVIGELISANGAEIYQTEKLK
jgi:hypothetical protein